MSIKTYHAQKMTSRDQVEMVALAKKAKKIFEGAGITVFDPVLEEHIKATHEPLIDKPLNLLKDYWKRDKEMIRKADVLVDLTPELKSEGVAHEIGYARYFLYMPIVRVFLNGSTPASMIAIFEDDLIVHSLEEAAVQINKYFGSWSKRFLWRIGIMNKSYLKSVWYRLQKWF